MKKDVEMLVIVSGHDEESEALLSLEPTAPDEPGLTNLTIGIDALSITLTHVDPDSLLELSHILREWASDMQIEKGNFKESEHGDVVS